MRATNGANNDDDRTTKDTEDTKACRPAEDGGSLWSAATLSPLWMRHDESSP